MLREDSHMFKMFCTFLRVFALSALVASASTVEESRQKLQQAETQRQSAYEQLMSRLVPAQKTKLESAEKAWKNFQTLAVDAFAQKTKDYRYSGEKASNEYSMALVWSRVSHLNRMLPPSALSGTDSDFQDADKMINDVYKDQRRSLERIEPSKALKLAQLAWIKYRDAAAESESAVCPDPVSAAIRVKTELTYERALFLHEDGFLLSQRLSQAPPDLQREFYLAQLLSKSKEIRQRSIDFFLACANDAFPLLLEQAKIGMLPVEAAPIFQKLGTAAIPPLLVLADDPGMANNVLPTLLAATGPAIISELLKRATSEKPEISMVATSALAQFGPQARDTIPTLLEITRNSGSVLQRAGAGRAALRIAPEDPEVAKVILDRYLNRPKNDSSIGEKDPFTDLVCSLGLKVKSVLPILIKDARDRKFDYNSLVIIEHLVSADEAELVPDLIDVLINPASRYWDYCGRSLAKIGDPAVPALLKLLQSTDTVTVQRAATVLVSMKQGSHEMATALLARLNSADTISTIAFIDLLAGIPQIRKESVPALLNLYKSNRPGLSTAALYALHAIAPDLEEVKRAWVPAPFVTDPYYDAECYRMPESTPSGPHYMITGDFNNDGNDDLAISGTEFGTGGGPWQMYLKVADRKYKKLDDFGAHHSITLFTGKQRGVGYIRIYWHMSAYTGNEELYKVTMDKLEMVKSVAVEWDEKRNEIPVDRDEAIPAPKDCTEKTLDAVAIDNNILFGKQSAGQSANVQK